MKAWMKYKTFSPRINAWTGRNPGEEGLRTIEILCQKRKKVFSRMKKLKKSCSKWFMTVDWATVEKCVLSGEHWEGKEQLIKQKVINKEKVEEMMSKDETSPRWRERTGKRRQQVQHIGLNITFEWSVREMRHRKFDYLIRKRMECKNGCTTCDRGKWASEEEKDTHNDWNKPSQPALKWSSIVKKEKT